MCRNYTSVTMRRTMLLLYGVREDVRAIGRDEGIWEMLGTYNHSRSSTQNSFKKLEFKNEKCIDNKIVGLLTVRLFL